MGAQDKTRMAMLNLSQLDRPGKSGRDLVLKPETDGRMILRQIMDGWKDFNDVLMPDYATILGERGLSARAIDTFGTLLAAARLLVGEVLEEIGLPMTDAGHLGELIAEATAADRTENLDHWHKCIDTLFQSQIDAWRDGVKPTIGGVCEKLLIGPQAGGWDARARASGSSWSALAASIAARSSRTPAPCWPCRPARRSCIGSSAIPISTRAAGTRR
jgi:hypothetical protein